VYQLDPKPSAARGAAHAYNLLKYPPLCHTRATHTPQLHCHRPCLVPSNGSWFSPCSSLRRGKYSALRVDGSSLRHEVLFDRAYSVLTMCSAVSSALIEDASSAHGGGNGMPTTLSVSMRTPAYAGADTFA
jgi:hypothetical protein